jgi:hypothetical protein
MAPMDVVELKEDLIERFGPVLSSDEKLLAECPSLRLLHLHFEWP